MHENTGGIKCKKIKKAPVKELIKLYVKTFGADYQSLLVAEDLLISLLMFDLMVPISALIAA
ncbi:hypothetical protein FLSA109164_09690 [Flavobacterium saliperosum]|uniref:Uncharacterized protein n=1 Tax=Flavobacterium saliperosum TaxID=329186 RepID=A0A1G4VFA7_9FLAO|nr:hypothetical protein SAMN02927925_00753 [Flavobacterium saliperosum]